MKVISDIVRIGSKEVDDQTFAAIGRAYPEGVHVSRASIWFDMKRSKNDPSTQQVLAILKLAGLRPWEDHSRARQSNEYWYREWRTYNAKDLTSSALLMLEPVKYREGLWRTEDGLIRMNRKWLRRARVPDFAKTTPLDIVVSQRVKELIESSKLRHVRFRPTVVEDDSGRERRILSWERVRMDPMWEITSDYVMPPLSPHLDLRDRKYQRVPPGSLEAYWLFEGHFIDPELHYLRKDITIPPEFDLAVTREPFGIPNGFDNKKVASQAFYQFCKEHGLKCGWIPVRMDDE